MLGGLLETVPVIGKVVEKGLDVIDELVEDKDQANRLKAQIRQRINEQNHEQNLAELKSQSQVVMGEVQGESWLQRNWRPLLMVCVMLIIANNYILVPYAGAR